MKKMRLSKFTAVLLLLTMGTLIAISSTYAKYTTSFTGTGTASTASWEIKLEPNSEGSNGIQVNEKTIEIEIGDKIYPGSEGTIGTLTVTNNSDTVKAELTEVEITDLKIEGTEISEPLKGRLTITAENESLSSPIASKGGTAEIKLAYKWEWSDDDETEYAGKSITFNVKVVVDQKQEA